MLAFTDESLARLIRAASLVSYRKRARWLEATARDLESGVGLAQNRAGARFSSLAQNASAEAFSSLNDFRRRELGESRPTGNLTSNAVRVRKYRARLRDGHRVYHLDLDSVAIEEMLRREGLLALDPTHAEVERALVVFLTKLAELSAE
jgi:hypothetical protein